MKKADRKEYRRQCKDAYKQIAQALYIRWGRKYDHLELRLEMAKWMLDYTMERQTESLNKKLRIKRRKKEAKKAKKIKKWLDAPVESANDDVLNLEI